MFGFLVFWLLIFFYYYYYLVPFLGLLLDLLWYMGMGASNFLSVEGNLDFLGGLLAKETLSGFGIFGTSLIKLHVDIFGELWTHGGVLSLPPFSFSASVMAKL